MMFHQMTRITSARGSIRQDDRLDALAIGCNYWVEQMAQDADRRISERKNDLAKEELSKFVDSFYKSRNSRKNSLSWIA
jgi:prefoldin subunit 5